MKIDSSCLEQYMFRSLCSLWEILSEIYINEPPALDSVGVCSKLYPGMLILVVKGVVFGDSTFRYTDYVEFGLN